MTHQLGKRFFELQAIPRYVEGGANKIVLRPASALCNIICGPWFNAAMVQVDDLDQKCFVKASMTEIKARVEKHVEAKEDKEGHLQAEMVIPAIEKIMPMVSKLITIKSHEELVGTRHE
ncbi:hypothetical protein CR513_32538, partial [Mucuna pruriens]